MDIYLNGVNAGGVYAGEGNSLAYNVNNSGNIGRHDTYASGPENYFHGSIDDLRFYNRALNFREIQALFNEK
jgi:hypothetical protein